MNCEVCIMNCGTCNWFDPPLALEIGHCRKNPPVTFRTGEDEYASVFPEVHPQDWCGQWEQGDSQAEKAPRRDQIT